MNAVDGDDARLTIEVAPLERSPLLGPQAGTGGENGDRREARVELGRDRLDLLPGREGLELGSLWLRVLDVPGGVLVDPTPAARQLAAGASRTLSEWRHTTRSAGQLR